MRQNWTLAGSEREANDVRRDAIRGRRGNDADEMIPRIVWIVTGLTLLAPQAFGFSTGSLSLVRTVNLTTALAGSAVTVTATLTNGGAAGLRGFYYADQLPSGLTVSTVKVTLNGRPVTDFTFESGQDGEVYAGLTPRRWRLETPTNFAEANPIPAGGVAQIVYSVTAPSAGFFLLQQFAWAACFADRSSTAFGCSEIADQQTLLFTNSALTIWSLYWQNATGPLAMWSMIGTNMASATLLQPSSAGAEWRVAGIGGFSGNGKEDLLLQSADGRLATWFMNGSQRIGGGYLNPNWADPQWKIAGTGDFNGDSKTDILWEHTGGGVACWFMDGTNRIGGDYLNPPLVDSNWRIVGTGDFNGDGKADILWEHTVGILACWLMDGTNRIGGGCLNPSTVDPNWKVVGTRDVNTDGQIDILWEHNSGTLAIWFMNGTNLMSASLLNPAKVDPSWKVVGLN